MRKEEEKKGKCKKGGGSLKLEGGKVWKWAEDFLWRGDFLTSPTFDCTLDYAPGFILKFCAKWCVVNYNNIIRKKLPKITIIWSNNIFK